MIHTQYATGIHRSVNTRDQHPQQGQLHSPGLARLSRSADTPRLTARARGLPPRSPRGTSPRLPVHGEVASDQAAGQAAGLPPNPGRAGHRQAAPQSLARDKQGAQIAQLGREANDQANDQTAVHIGGSCAFGCARTVTRSPCLSSRLSAWLVVAGQAERFPLAGILTGRPRRHRRRLCRWRAGPVRSWPGRTA